MAQLRCLGGATAGCSSLRSPPSFGGFAVIANGDSDDAPATDPWRAPGFDQWDASAAELPGAGGAM
eukprot:7711351-Pyramimonas_sp.AAC.1